jgi:hypothetical protein
MYRIISASKDTYITNKIINSKFRAVDANLGQAGTLDLFKLYAENISGSDKAPIELTRLLIEFDIGEVKKMHDNQIINVGNKSFKAELKLHDIYGGQTTPSNFNVIVFPLAKSFDEGIGSDVINYTDLDSTNWITASFSNSTISPWNTPGAMKSGSLGDSNIDVIVSGSVGGERLSLAAVQSFKTGEEDLQVDITNFVSASAKGLISNHGFLIALSGSHEKDNYTYFVKRFASRNTTNTAIRPKLIIKFDDTLSDNHENFEFDITGSLYLNNFNRGSLTNILSGTAASQLTGESCLFVKVESGSFKKIFTGSQVLRGDSKKSSATFTFTDKPNEETYIQLIDVHNNTVSFEIDNEADGLKKSSATFTFTDKPNEGSTITITDSAETSATFEIDNEVDGVTSDNIAVDGIYLAGGGATGTAVNLVAKINAQTSLDIVATNPSGAVVLLTQGTGGRSGNKEISVNNSTHWNTKTSVNVPAAFTGGVGDVAINNISSNGGGATGTAIDLATKINANAINITAVRDGDKVTLTQDIAGALGDIAITNNFTEAALSVAVPSAFSGGAYDGITGVYSASFAISSFDAILYNHALSSGSIKFNEIWSNKNETVTYLSSSLTITKNNRSAINFRENRYLMSMLNLKQRYRQDEYSRLRVFIENSDRNIVFSKTPVEKSSEIFPNVYYRVRDFGSGNIIVPFDAIDNATKLSSDQIGMYFDFYMSTLPRGRSYVFDFMIKQNGFDVIVKDAASKFIIE